MQKRERTSVNEGLLFITPPGVYNRKDIVFNQIISLCPGNDYSSVLYIGPSSPFLATARHLFFSYLKENGKKTTFIPFQTLTVKQLASRLYEIYGQQEVISDEVRTLVLLHLLEEKNFGYTRLLSELLKKCKHYMLYKVLSELQSEIDHLVHEEKARVRARNALDILQSYENFLQGRQLIDSETVLLESIAMIKKYLSPAIVIIDGFFDPTPLELAVLKALITKADNAIILAEERTPLSNISNGDFPMDIKKIKSAHRRVSSGFYPYASIEDEVEGIAKSIKMLMIDGVIPSDITVSFPVLSKYLPITKRVFKKHGIPVSIGDQDLSGSAPVIAMHEIISCIEDDYPRNDFLSVLTSPLFPAIPLLVKAHAVALSYKAGIIKGKESWLSIENTICNDPEDSVAKDREIIKEFQSVIKGVIDLLENIRNAKDVSTYIEACESALDTFGFFDAREGDRANLEARVIDKIRRQFSEFRRFAEANKHSEGHSINAGLYLRFLLSDLSGSDMNQNGVLVVPFDQATSFETKELFFGGMIEGEFPSRPGIDPILPEKVKKDLGMPHLEYYIERQRRYFSRLLNISKSHPHFSCPTADGDKVFLPSPFLDWEQNFNPVALNIFSREEVLIREGAMKGVGKMSRIRWDGSLRLNRQSLRLVNERLRGYLNVTDIDFYRKCPMRFYLERVMQLEAVEPPQFAVEARLWGSLLHKIMERLFRDGDVEMDDIERMLFRYLEMSLEQFPINAFWGNVAREILQKLLPQLKKQESDIRMQGYRPFMVEKKLTAEVNGLRLKGKIDRVDGKTGDLHNGNMKSVILMDYKTGGLHSDSLQMPLYALMWMKNFSEPVDKVGYYSLKEGKVSWYPVKISMDQYTQDALTAAEDLIIKMRKGYFPPEPFSTAECRYCTHSPLCKTPV